MTIQLREATERDIPAIARIAATAFHPSTDSITRRLFPPHLQPADIPDGEAAHIWRLARKASSLTSPRTVMMVAVDDSSIDEALGFTLWEIPVQSKTAPSAPAVSEPPVGFDQEAYSELRAVVAQDATDTFGETGTERIWHLDYIGVAPEHYRKGIGRLLLDWGVRQAAREEKDCYLLATPAGRPLYIKAAFEDVRVVTIFGVPHHSMIIRQSRSRGM